jgi:hypothetical protein
MRGYGAQVFCSTRGTLYSPSRIDTTARTLDKTFEYAAIHSVRHRVDGYMEALVPPYELLTGDI